MQAMIITQNQENADFFGMMLRKEGLTVTASRQVKRAIPALVERPVDLILYSTSVDDTLLATVPEIRKSSSAQMIMVVDWLTEDLHCALLDAGADWVLTRPLSPRVFPRYLRRLLRRTSEIPVSVLSEIRCRGVILNPAARTVRIGEGEAQRLTQLEFRLLYILMTTPGYVFTTDELVERVWGYDGEGNRGLVRGLVRRLRRKIEPNSDTPQYILNIPSHGYQFADGDG